MTARKTQLNYENRRWEVHNRNSTDGKPASKRMACWQKASRLHPWALVTASLWLWYDAWFLPCWQRSVVCVIKKKKKKGDEYKWYGSLCIAQWSGIVWFGKEMLTCAWIQQGFIKSVPCAGTVLASAGTKALLIYALRSSEHRGETDNEEPHCYLIWSMKEKKHQVKY